MTPTALSSEEVQTWLVYNRARPEVAEYLSTAQPPWGIIVKDPVAPGVTNTLLLFIPTHQAEGSSLIHFDPAELRIALIDATDPIVEQVNKAPFVSPDDTGFWSNFMTDLREKTGAGLELGLGTLKWAVVGLIALGVLQLTRK